MNLTTKRMLDEEYERTLAEVSQAKTGSDEAKWALQKLAELHKQMAEDRMNDNKCCVEMQKVALEERETLFKEQQAKEGKLLNVIKRPIVTLVPSCDNAS